MKKMKKKKNIQRSKSCLCNRPIITRVPHKSRNDEPIENYICYAHDLQINKVKVKLFKCKIFKENIPIIICCCFDVGVDPEHSTNVVKFGAWVQFFRGTSSSPFASATMTAGSARLTLAPLRRRRRRRPTPREASNDESR